MQLTIIFITACCISLFSHATQCTRCNKEPPNCHCVRTVADLQDTTRCTHHAGSNKIPSLDNPDNQTLPVQNASRNNGPVTGSIIKVPDIRRATFTIGSPQDSGEATASSSYGCRINRKKKERQPFTGDGRSLQAPSSQNSGESAQHSDILGIIDQPSHFQINSATGGLAQTLTAINVAFSAALSLENPTDNQQTRDSLLNETLQTVGYRLRSVEIADAASISFQIRRQVDNGSIVYLMSGSNHYIFIPDFRDRIFTVSYFFQHPSNPEYQNTIRRGLSQSLSNIKLSNPEPARLYIIK